MIRPLRRLHLAMIAGLMAGSVVAIATASREAPRGSNEANLELGPGPGPETMIATLGLALAVGADSSGTVVSVRATRPLGVPDPLLYYLEGPPSDPTALPANARFLGAVAARHGSTTRHPPGTLRPGGFLVLWSTGHGRVVATGSFPRVAGGEP
ncbi:MAG: hypothetical protein ACKVZ0_12815 [Gemmatimonadales bacterium]